MPWGASEDTPPRIPASVVHLRLHPDVFGQLVSESAQPSVRLGPKGLTLTIGGLEYTSQSAECDHTAVTYRKDSRGFEALGHTARCQVPHDGVRPGGTCKRDEDGEPLAKRPKVGANPQTSRSAGPSASSSPISEPEPHPMEQQLLEEHFRGNREELQRRRAAFWTRTFAGQAPLLQQDVASGMTVPQLVVLYFVDPSRARAAVQDYANESGEEVAAVSPDDEALAADFASVPVPAGECTTGYVTAELEGALRALWDAEDAAPEAVEVNLPEVATPQEYAAALPAFQALRSRAVALHGCLLEAHARVTAAQDFCRANPSAGSGLAAFLRCRAPALQARWKVLSETYVQVDEAARAQARPLRNYQHLMACANIMCP